MLPQRDARADARLETGAAQVVVQPDPDDVEHPAVRIHHPQQRHDRVVLLLAERDALALPRGEARGERKMAAMQGPHAYPRRRHPGPPSLWYARPDADVNALPLPRNAA